MMFEDVSDDYVQYCDSTDSHFDFDKEYSVKVWDRASTEDSSDVDKLVADFMKYWRNNG